MLRFLIVTALIASWVESAAVPDLRAIWSQNASHSRPIVITQNGTLLNLTSAVSGLSGTGEIDMLRRTLTLNFTNPTQSHTANLPVTSPIQKITFPSFTLDWLQWWAVTTRNITFVDSLLRPWQSWNRPYNLSVLTYQMGSTFSLNDSTLNWSMSPSVSSPTPTWDSTLFQSTLSASTSNQTLEFKANTFAGTYRVTAMFTEKYVCSAVPRCLQLGINGQSIYGFNTSACGTGQILTVSNIQSTGETTVSVSAGVIDDCISDAQRAPIISSIAVEPFTKVPGDSWPCLEAHVEIRYGCTCDHGTVVDGAWCAYRGTCYQGECVTCPHGWSRFESACYAYFNQIPLSWYDAERKCRSLDASLVSLYSMNQSVFVSQLILAGDRNGVGLFSTGFPVWTGGYFDQDSYQKWKWTNGAAMFPAFLTWGSGKPSAPNVINNNIRCIQFVGSNRSTLEDGDCERRGPYACMSQTCLRLDTIPPIVAENIYISNLNQTIPTCIGGVCYNNSIQTTGKSRAIFLPPIGYARIRGCFVRRSQDKGPCGDVKANISVGSYVYYSAMSNWSTSASCFNTMLISGASLTFTTEYAHTNTSVTCSDSAWINTRVCRSHTRPCGKKWMNFDNTKCIQHFTDLRSFSDANKICQQEGGTLHTIESERENNFTMTVVLDASIQAWIGALTTPPFYQLPYSWINQIPMIYTKWVPTTPAAVIGPGCGYFINKQWKAQTCSTKLSFLCQKVKSVTPSLSRTLRTPSKELLTQFETSSQSSSRTESQTFLSTSTVTISHLSPSATTTSTRRITHDHSLEDSGSLSESLEQTGTPSVSNELSNDRTRISPSVSHSVPKTRTPNDTITETLSVTNELSGIKTITVDPTLTNSQTPTVTISTVPGFVYWKPYEERLLTSMHLSTKGFTLTAVIQHDTFYHDTIISQNYAVRSDNLDSRGVGFFCGFDPASSVIHSACVLKFKTRSPNGTSETTFPYTEVEVIIGPEYTLRNFNPETVYLTFFAKSVRVGLAPVPQPLSFVVLPEESCDDMCSLMNFVSFLGSLAGLLRLAFGASLSMVMQLPTLSSISSFRCYSVEAIELDFLIHPLRFAVGTSRLKYHHGAAIGNFTLMVFFVILHLLITFVCFKKGGSLPNAMAVTHFPSYSFIPCLLLFPGFNVGALKVAAYGSGLTKIYGIAFTLVVDGGVFFVLYRWFFQVFMSHYEDVNIQDQTVGDDGALLNREYWLSARGIWADYDTQYTFHPRWKLLYNDYKGSARFWMMSELIFTLLFTAASSIDGKTTEACNIKTTLIDIIAVTYFLLIAYIRPFTVRAYNILSIVMALSIVVSVTLVLAVNIKQVRDEKILYTARIILFLAALMYSVVFTFVHLRYLYRWLSGKEGPPSILSGVFSKKKRPYHHMKIEETNSRNDIYESNSKAIRRNRYELTSPQQSPILRTPYLTSPAQGSNTPLSPLATHLLWNSQRSPSPKEHETKEPSQEPIPDLVDIWRKIQKDMREDAKTLPQYEIEMESRFAQMSNVGLEAGAPQRGYLPPVPTELTDEEMMGIL